MGEPMSETESVTANSEASSAADTRQMEPSVRKSLLVQWALYFRRFDPLLDPTADFEQER
jgi:hypothetical protein